MTPFYRETSVNFRVYIPMSVRTAKINEDRLYTELFRFAWATDKDGYEVVEDLPRAKAMGSTLLTRDLGPIPNQLLTARSRVPFAAFLRGPLHLRRRGGLIKPYKLLPEATRVHREFAELEKSPDAVATFARKYGYLGLEDGGTEDEYGECLDDWYKWIDAISVPLFAFDQYTTRNHPELLKIIAKSTMQFPNVKWKLGFEFRNFRGKDLLVPYNIPTTLISAIVLFTVFEITRPDGARIQWKRCENCSKFIAIAPGFKDERAKFCNNACKVACYQRVKRNKAKRIVRRKS